MSASDLRDDIRKERKTAGEWFLLFLSTPLIIYYTFLSLWDLMVELNREYADKLFLKRIRMSQEEFDQFMSYKRCVENMPKKLRPQPSYDDDDDCDLNDFACGIHDNPMDLQPDGCKDCGWVKKPDDIIYDTDVEPTKEDDTEKCHYVRTSGINV